jgi:hypothetical protein
MLRLIKFLFTGSWHEHKWKIIDQGSLTTDFGPGTWYDLQCETCGNIKTKKVY